MRVLDRSPVSDVVAGMGSQGGSRGRSRSGVRARRSRPLASRSPVDPGETITESDIGVEHLLRTGCQACREPSHNSDPRMFRVLSIFGGITEINARLDHLSTAEEDWRDLRMAAMPRAWLVACRSSLCWPAVLSVCMAANLRVIDSTRYGSVGTKSGIRKRHQEPSRRGQSNR